MKKNILKLPFVLLAFVLFSCGSKNGELALMDASDSIEEMADMELGKTEVSSENIGIERKIIKTGRIEFETSDVLKTKILIVKKVAQFNGWISHENSDRYRGNDDIRYNLTVRIPSQYFDVLLDSISVNAKKIMYKNVSSQDVTEEFIDLGARLSTKKDLENRYKQLLQKAGKVEEILAIEREIGTLRSEIESIEGRYKYLQNQVSFSTLDITYYKKAGKTTGFGSDFIEAIGTGWEVLLAFLIVLAKLWAFIIVAVVIAFFVIKKRKAKRKAK